MSFSVKSLGSLLGKDARTLVPANAVPVSSSTVGKSVSRDEKFNIPLPTSEYKEDKFDLDGDGSVDVMRRQFGVDKRGRYGSEGSVYSLTDKAGDKTVAWAAPEFSWDQPAQRIWYTVADVGAEHRLQIQGVPDQVKPR